MTDRQFSREMRFLIGMCFFCRLVPKGIINADQYKELMRMLVEKYMPPLGLLPLTN